MKNNFVRPKTNRNEKQSTPKKHNKTMNRKYDFRRNFPHENQYPFNLFKPLCSLILSKALASI